jgi:hypothetical protein
MKIKTMIIFLSAFLIGLILVPQKETLSPPEKTSLDIPAALPKPLAFTAPEFETKFDPDLFGLADFGEENVSKFKMKLVDVLEHGNSYRKDEVIAKSGENWLGLFEENGKIQLRGAKISVRPESRDDYEYGVTIKVNSKTAPKFLLKNAGTLKQGEVETLYSSPVSEDAERLGLTTLKLGLTTLKKEFIQEFRLGERRYIFRVRQGLTKSKAKVLALVLESDNTSQIVAHQPYFEEGDYVGNLLWVGDLDRDGKVDFYMDFNSYEKGSFSSSLFLSSEAEKGELVKEVAAFGTLGC